MIADRVIVLRDGAVVADGAPALLASSRGAISRITFAPVPGVDPAALPLPVRVSGNRWEIQVPQLTEALHTLTGWALDADVQLTGMSIASPRLEDVYLELTR